MSRPDPYAVAAASKLRGVAFRDVECKSIEGKGWGLTTIKDLNTRNASIDDLPKLITIPHDLVLNQQTVDEYAKGSVEFKELYEAVGRQVSQPSPDFLLPSLILVRLTCSRLVISDFARDSLRDEMFFYSSWCS